MTERIRNETLRKRLIEILTSPDKETKLLIGGLIKTCGSITEDPFLTTLYRVIERDINLSKDVCASFGRCDNCPLIPVCRLSYYDNTGIDLETQ